jgi:hypothetical protein
MNRLFACTCILVGAILLGACARDAPPAAAAPATPPEQEAGPGVTVDAAQLERMGVELAPVRMASAGTVASGTAIVLDGEAFAAALDEFTAARADAEAQARNAQRLAGLRAEGNASEQALESARSQAAAARAHLSAAEAKARADWGAELVDADAATLHTLRMRLLQRRAALMRAEFPGALPADPAGLEYAIDIPVPQAPSVIAKFVGVSRAPATAAYGAAVTLAAATDAPLGWQPRPGARLPVTASTHDGPQRALVPESAAIADAGQLWCYVQRPEGRFDRVPLIESQRIGAQYPSPGLKDGDRVVIRGAALLLSLERGAGVAEGAPAGDED